MRISDWSSDVCSSDLDKLVGTVAGRWPVLPEVAGAIPGRASLPIDELPLLRVRVGDDGRYRRPLRTVRRRWRAACHPAAEADRRPRSEEHTSELQSLMRISYAVFCLKKKKNNHHI